MIDKLLFGEKNNIIKRNYSLNTLAGLINAFRPVIMQMMVTRFTGIKDAGIMTIAFAIANLLVTVGKFGVRNFQVTDLERKYSYTVYFKARIATVGLMLGLSVGYFLYGYFFANTSMYKLLIIMTICMIFMIDAVEDVFWGDYQLKGRLDVGAVIYIIRWGITIVFFGTSLLIFKNLLLSNIIAFIVSLILFVALIDKTYPILKDKETIKNSGTCIALLKNCMPLFIGAFLMIYITNSPKYAIERYLSDEIQACFGFVSMPIFVIELLNNFLYQPKLVEIAAAWEDRQKDVFKKYILRQGILLGFLTIICLIGANLLGIPVLSILYSVDLKDYKIILLLLLLGGGFLALTGFFAVLLTVMRKQNWMMYGYVIIAIISLVVMPKAVYAQGVMGGTIAFIILIFSLSFLLFSAVVISCKRYF